MPSICAAYDSIPSTAQKTKSFKSPCNHFLAGPLDGGMGSAHNRTEVIPDLFVASKSPFCNKSLFLAQDWTPSACVLSKGWGWGESPSPEAGRELKNTVTTHLTVDISTRCEAEGEGKRGTGLRLSACPALGLLESLQPMTDLASGSSPDLKADVDTQALRT